MREGLDISAPSSASLAGPCVQAHPGSADVTEEGASIQSAACQSNVKLKVRDRPCGDRHIDRQAWSSRG